MVNGIDDFMQGQGAKRGELLAQLNSTLDAMKADGSFDKIYRKWFGS